jgi:hypothetical protein
MRQHGDTSAGGGLLGTLLQTMTMYGVMPLMLGRSVDPAAMLGHACAVSLLAHVFSGVCSSRQRICVYHPKACRNYLSSRGSSGQGSSERHRGHHCPSAG